MKLHVKVILVLAAMQVNLIVTAVAVSPDQEGTFNSCCQDPPGAPGSNENHGQHGSVGPRGDASSPGEVGEPGANKGDKGLDGLVGEPGAKWDHGLTGEQGMGRQGNQGPQGLPGMDGLKGERGEPGPAGQKGDAGECSTRRSAFTAMRNTPFSPSFSYDPLPFEELLFSEEGTDFNLANGTFMCTVPGVYVFMFSVMKPSSVSYLWVQLRKNGSLTVTGYVTASGYHQVSSSAVISLHSGDQVYLNAGGSVYGNYMHVTSFTGFLLH